MLPLRANLAPSSLTAPNNLSKLAPRGKKRVELTALGKKVKCGMEREILLRWRETMRWWCRFYTILSWKKNNGPHFPFHALIVKEGSGISTWDGVIKIFDKASFLPALDLENTLSRLFPVSNDLPTRQLKIVWHCDKNNSCFVVKILTTVRSWIFTQPP